MPVVVVATLTVKPESVDTVRDILTAAVEEVHANPVASCIRYTNRARPLSSSSNGPTTRR